MSANQSRRRTDPGQGPEGGIKPKIDNTLAYKGRELDDDSIRLVRIQPASGETDPIVCTLSEAPFGSKPKFEALSYMWGTDPADEPISLNGIPFEVGKNLWDALVFLRRQVAAGKARQPFWIDAICINQDNVDERNRQLRIMDQIYFRAETVVVWLGSRYAESQRAMAAEVKPSNPQKGKGVDKPAVDKPAVDKPAVEQKMVRCLQTDPYWERLWILQEIGRARKLRVCYGEEASPWESFTRLMEKHNKGGGAHPLRLDRLLRKEKYEDGHTLKRLLEEHIGAKCKEPRDKIYGLVGLASDAAKFPMDYSKSLYDVWKDTMVFMNERRLFKDESQILTTGALIKSALMADHSDPWSWISRSHQPGLSQLISNSENPLVFTLQAVTLGCVVEVGPLANDLVSRSRAAAEWRFSTQRHFPGDQLGAAVREHDELFEALLESDDSDVERMCFNRPSTVVRATRSTEYPTRYSTTLEYPAQYIFNVREGARIVPLKSPPESAPRTDKLASVQPRLYLAKQYKTRGTTGRKMGVASDLVQPEDLICWVRSTKRALLVRVVDQDSGSAIMRVFGTALTTEDMRGPKLDPDFFAQRWSSLDDEWRTEVYVDAETIFMLLL